MKRLFTLLLAILLLLCPIVSASAVTDDVTSVGKTVVDYGDWVIEKINNGTEWELDEYKGSDADIVTPRFIDGMLVVAFGDYCFKNNQTVKSVSTDTPLWTIGEYCFLNCTALESIELNYALHTIGVGAFAGTSALKSINLHGCIVSEIKANTFLNSGIEEVELPKTCTKLDGYAFGQCESLTKITIPDSVTEIHEDAFKGSDHVVIYCNTDSYAHQYAEANNIEYVLLDEKVTFICGDADGDGEITIVDATRIQRVLAQLDEDPDGMIALRGDSDEDGLYITDATTIQRYLASYSITAPVGETLTRPKPVVNA